MGFFEKIKQIFSGKKKEEALQSASKRFNSDLNRLNHRFKALQIGTDSTIHSEKEEEKHADRYTGEDFSGFTKLSHKPIEPKLSEPVELQKESLQLGVAAGYTGRAIKEIESSLERIEREMASREWFLSNFGYQKKIPELLNEIKNLLEKHDLNASKRFETIESALNRLAYTAMNAPEPLKKELISQIETIRSNLPLTSKMKKLIEVVKESGYISYDDLASKLSVSRSSLRGLLSNTIKRTSEIERYYINGKGWVRYKHPKTTQLDNF